MDTHENVDEHWDIGVDAGRNWEILFESCLTVRRRVHEFGAGNAIARLVFDNRSLFSCWGNGVRLVVGRTLSFVSR